MNDDCPRYERLSYEEVFHGMMFYFSEVSAFDPGPAFDIRAPWTVIAKERPIGSDSETGIPKYLLLGPGPVLEWFYGNLGWIHCIADPVWEERERRRTKTINVEAW